MKQFIACLFFFSVLTAEYQPKDYSHLFGTPGFPDALFKLHFQLYQGYVKNTNLLAEKLKDPALQNTYEYGALKRRFAWEFDGMRLHELYFENLGGKAPLASKTALAARIARDFGSMDAWQADFIATGAMRGIGWAVLYYDKEAGRLFNTWIDEHDLGHLAGGAPVLVMDVFEHAYITVWGLDRKAYIDAFFKNINWAVCSSRFDHAN